MVSILLVDDHPAICFALKVLLEKQGDFEIRTSAGDNLLAQLHQQTPQLLILDLELQQSDGLDLLPRIVQHFPELKIVIFTSQPASIYAARTLHAGAQGFISKNESLDFIAPLCRLIMAGYHCFPACAHNAAGARADAGQTSQALLNRFSDREIAVLRYLRQGNSHKEIAALLKLSNKTISTYKARMLQKSGCDDIHQLCTLLFSEGGREMG